MYDSPTGIDEVTQILRSDVKIGLSSLAKVANTIRWFVILCSVLLTGIFINSVYRTLSTLDLQGYYGEGIDHACIADLQHCMDASTNCRPPVRK